MLELALPDVTRREAWLESHLEWGPGQHEDGFGVGPDDGPDSADGFAAMSGTSGMGFARRPVGGALQPDSTSGPEPQ